MTNPVLPYEPHSPRPTGRHIFGVIVRTAGLIAALYGIYNLAYLVVVFTMTTNPYPARTFIIFGAIFLLVGILLIRGEWLVRFAYGRE